MGKGNLKTRLTKRQILQGGWDLLNERLSDPEETKASLEKQQDIIKFRCKAVVRCWLAEINADKLVQNLQVDEGEPSPERPMFIQCPICKGSKKYPGSSHHPCEECGGEGYVTHDHESAKPREAG